MKKEKVIHCDLKPENIMLKQKNKTGLKLIDFGSSCSIGDDHFTYIQSLYYRAPEVILGYTYSSAIDMWSFGCIIFELRFGYPPFKGKDDRDQLYSIMERCGLPNLEMLKASKRANIFFDEHLDYKVKASDHKRKINSGTIKEMITLQC
jgi:dual specificity tyrosine-phosphorylation-regulated kinase 2/3/4